VTGKFSRAWRALPRTVRVPVGVVARTVRLYIDDSCGTYAAAIAYYAIFSLVPLSLIILSIFGLVVKEGTITSFVFDQLPLKETASVHDNVQQIVQRAHDISFAGLSFGVVALIWSSSGIFSAVRKGLNAASHRKRQRPYWHGKLMDFTLIPALGLLITLSVGLTGASQVVIERLGGIGPLNFDANLALRISSYIIPAAISLGMFALLYKYVPTTRPGWPETLSGAAFATFLFEITKNFYAVVFSMTAFSKDTAIYAGFGNALGFLLWLFLNASILLLGAEFGRAVRHEAVPDQAHAEETAADIPVETLPARPARPGGIA
jgi:membrane protein